MGQTFGTYVTVKSPTLNTVGDCFACFVAISLAGRVEFETLTALQGLKMEPV